MSYKARELAFKLGDKLGIETDDSAELVDRLAGFTGKELIAASGELMKTEVRDGAWSAFVGSKRRRSFNVAKSDCRLIRIQRCANVANVALIAS